MCIFLLQSKVISFKWYWMKTVAEVEPFLCKGDKMMYKVYSTRRANYLLPNILCQAVRYSSVVLGISFPRSDFLLIHKLSPEKGNIFFTGCSGLVCFLIPIQTQSNQNLNYYLWIVIQIMHSKRTVSSVDADQSLNETWLSIVFLLCCTQIK